jgi:4a-hydroxytetrahydrobiopterin dehydratase
MSSLEKLATKRSFERRGSPLTPQEVEPYLLHLPGWRLVEEEAIEKEFRFKTYLDGVAFASGIGKIAEEQNHHPDILIKWRRVKVIFSTHSVKGLSENDFIMAARSELKYREFTTE